MPALLCVKENEKVVSLWWKISPKEAGALLFRYKPQFSQTRWTLKGPARPLPAGFVERDRYAIHLESKLGNFAPGYYLFGNAQPTPTDLIALTGTLAPVPATSLQARHKRRSCVTRIVGQTFQALLAK